MIIYFTQKNITIKINQFFAYFFQHHLNITLLVNFINKIEYIKR